jgi:hypothetical protein
MVWAQCRRQSSELAQQLDHGVCTTIVTQEMERWVGTTSETLSGHCTEDVALGMHHCWITVWTQHRTWAIGLTPHLVHCQGIAQMLITTSGAPFECSTENGARSIIWAQHCRWGHLVCITAGSLSGHSTGHGALVLFGALSGHSTELMKQNSWNIVHTQHSNWRIGLAQQLEHCLGTAQEMEH